MSLSLQNISQTFIILKFQKHTIKITRRKNIINRIHNTHWLKHLIYNYWYLTIDKINNNYDSLSFVRCTFGVG